MNKPLIRNITVLTQPECTVYNVDIDQNVGRIEDAGLEYEDHIHALYHVYDREDRRIATIENCPVIVEYYTEEKAKKAPEPEESPARKTPLYHVKASSTLVREWDKLAARVQYLPMVIVRCLMELRGIIQNDMTITGDQLNKWLKDVEELQGDLRKYDVATGHLEMLYNLKRQTMDHILGGAEK